MTPLSLLFPVLFAFFFSQDSNLQLGQDLSKDAKILANTSVFISDNATSSPSMRTIESDLELFFVMASINLTQSKYSARQQGRHHVQTWRYNEGNIKAIHQIETTLALDTVVTQRYLEDRAPTQQRIQNNFKFRTYAVSTTDARIKLYYLTEEEQGLLKYKIDDRHVELVYPKKKQGLSDIMPKVKDEMDQLVVALSKE